MRTGMRSEFNTVLLFQFACLTPGQIAAVVSGRPYRVASAFRFFARAVGNQKNSRGNSSRSQDRGGDGQKISEAVIKSKHNRIRTQRTAIGSGHHIVTQRDYFVVTLEKIEVCGEP